MNINNIFSEDELNQILQNPTVMQMYERIVKKETNKIYFTVNLPSSIKQTLCSALNIDLTNVENVPMRMLSGDTAPHIDIALNRQTFANTYLVYLNDCIGDFVLDDATYKITKNTGFKFNYGKMHGTINTLDVPRVILGPFNESGIQVGLQFVQYYYSNPQDALAGGGNYIYTQDVNGDIATVDGITAWAIASNSTGSATQGVVYNSGDHIAFDGAYYLYPAYPIVYYNSLDDAMNTVNPLQTQYNGTYVVLSVSGINVWSVAPNSTGSFIPSNIYNVGDELFYDGTYNMYPYVACYNENATVLCNVNEVEKYVPINELQIGDMVKTYKHGLVKIKHIKTGCLTNGTENDTQCLYKYDKNELIVSGGHSILVDELDEDTRKEQIKQYGFDSMIDDKHLLLACMSKNFTKIMDNACYNIYHICLESNDTSKQYGIYVNGGILSETISEKCCAK